MQIVEKKTDELKTYENNPRNIDDAVAFVASSIEQFGFRVPIIIDKDNVIVAGHTRLQAAKQLDLDTVPCIIADDLNEQQLNAFRLADNKTSELAKWDYEKLFLELEEMTFDMEQFGFVDDEAKDIDADTLEGLRDELFEDKAEHIYECPNCHFEGKIEEYIKE